MSGPDRPVNNPAIHKSGKHVHVLRSVGDFDKWAEAHERQLLVLGLMHHPLTSALYNGYVEYAKAHPASAA